MTLEHDDGQRALNEASDILDETRQREIGLPLGVAYWVGMTLVTTSPKEDGSDKRQITSSIVSRLEQVIPQELIEMGSEDYTGDLGAVVQVPLSQRDVEHIGQAVLLLPTGRRIIDSLPIDPNDRAELEGFRNKQLRAFLFLYDEFARVGGKTNPDTKIAIERELS